MLVPRCFDVRLSPSAFHTQKRLSLRACGYIISIAEQSTIQERSKARVWPRCNHVLSRARVNRASSACSPCALKSPSHPGAYFACAARAAGEREKRGGWCFPMPTAHTASQKHHRRSNIDAGMLLLVLIVMEGLLCIEFYTSQENIKIKFNKIHKITLFLRRQNMIWTNMQSRF